MSRREFLKTSGTIGAAAAAMGAAGALGRAAADLSPETMPRIKLAGVEVSRLMLGSNPFWGYAHGGDGKAMRAYYTDEVIMQTLDDAGACGITAVISPPSDRWHAIWKAYKERGGKLAHYVAQTHGKPEQMKEEISWGVEAGATIVFIQGLRCDAQFKDGNFETLASWLEHIRSLKLPCGLASHRPDTHPEYQLRGLPLDFHFQSFYPNDRWDPADREKAVATLTRLEKPVVGYKILAAGHIPAKEGFEFAFKHLKPKDGVCVGVFPKDDPDQVAEDAGLCCRCSKA